MAEDNNDTRVRFERQRRNLLVISVLLIIYISLDLKLDTISILGNSFSIENNKNVEFLFWVLFVYFLIRYYQYFKVVDNNEFLSVLYSSMDKYVARAAFNKFKKSDFNDLIEQNPDGSNFKYALEDFSISSRHQWRWDIRISGSRTWKLGTGAGSSGFRKLECTVTNTQLLWPKLKSYFVVYFKTPHVTEYSLPFVLSIITVIVKLN